MALPTPSKPPRAGYSVPRLKGPIRLKLDANEGLPPPRDWLLPILEGAVESVHRYPKPEALRSRLAARFQVDPGQVLVSAGGDESIERAVRTFGPSKTILTPSPTFEMFSIYAELYGARVHTIPWGPPSGPEAFPVEAFIRSIREIEDLGVVALVSPNSPTGLALGEEDFAQVMEAVEARAQPPLVVVDHAYVEYGGVDLTQRALAHPACFVVRTFSKAYGLAGLRVGYGLGPREVVAILGSQGTPYPYSRLSLAMAERMATEDPPFVRARIEQVHRERDRLAQFFVDRGHGATRSQGNFVWVRVRGEGQAEALWRGLGEDGIGVRFFSRTMAEFLRITCPGDQEAFAELMKALDSRVREPT